MENFSYKKTKHSLHHNGYTDPSLCLAVHITVLFKLNLSSKCTEREGKL